MLNAIDINQFLAQETMGASDGSPNSVAAMLSAMSLSAIQLVAQYKVSRDVGLYCMLLKQDQLGLFDASTGKKVLFQYDPKTGLISVNEHRAQANDISFFLHRLNQLAQIGLAIPHLKGGEGNTEQSPQLPELPAPLIAKLAQVFHFSLPLEWESLDSAQFKPMVQLLNALAKTIQQTVRVSNDDAKMTVLFDYVRDVISSQNLNHSDDVVLVTNKTTAGKSSGVIYTMQISLSQITIEFQRQGDVSSIVLQPNQHVATLDGESIKANGIDWVIQQCQKIVGDMNSNKAAVFESIVA